MSYEINLVKVCFFKTYITIVGKKEQLAVKISMATN